MDVWGGAARGAPVDTVVRLALMLARSSGGTSLMSVAASESEAQ